MFYCEKFFSGIKLAIVSFNNLVMHFEEDYREYYKEQLREVMMPLFNKFKETFITSLYIEEFKDELKPVSAQMLTERIENEFFQVLDKNILVNDLCMLPDNKILAASCNQHKMILYDKNFEIIKEIDKIDDKVFSPLSLATDNDEKI